jgi:hypothetical protein
LVSRSILWVMLAHGCQHGVSARLASGSFKTVTFSHRARDADTLTIPNPAPVFVDRCSIQLSHGRPDPGQISPPHRTASDSCDVSQRKTPPSGSPKAGSVGFLKNQMRGFRSPLHLRATRWASLTSAPAQAIERQMRHFRRIFACVYADTGPSTTKREHGWRRRFPWHCTEARDRHVAGISSVKLIHPIAGAGACTPSGCWSQAAG